MTPFILRGTLVWMINDMDSPCNEQGRSDIFGFNTCILISSLLFTNQAFSQSFVWSRQCSFSHIFAALWLYNEKQNTHGLPHKVYNFTLGKVVGWQIVTNYTSKMS